MVHDAWLRRLDEHVDDVAVAAMELDETLTNGADARRRSTARPPRDTSADLAGLSARLDALVDALVGATATEQASARRDRQALHESFDELVRRFEQLASTPLDPDPDLARLVVLVDELAGRLSRIETLLERPASRRSSPGR